MEAVSLNDRGRHERLQIIIAIILIILIVAPMFWMLQYMTLSEDDFSNGSARYMGIIERTARKFVYGYTYNGGAIFSTLFVGATPFSYVGIIGAIIPCALLILTFFLSILALIRVVLKNIFKSTKWSITLWFFVGILFLITQFVNPSELYYWYTGAFGYMLPLVTMIFSAVCLIKFVTTDVHKKRWFVLTAIFLFVSTLNSLIYLVIIFLTTFLLFAIFRSKKSPHLNYFKILLIIMLCGTVINLVAPGNFTRYDTVNSSLDPLRMIWVTFSYVTFDLTPRLLTETWILPLGIIAFPVMLRLCRNANYDFKYAWIIMIASYIIWMAGFYPYILYHGRIHFYDRIVALTWIFFVFSFFLGLFCLAGWLSKRKALEFSTLKEKALIAMIAVAFLMVSLGNTSPKDWTSVNIVDHAADGTIQAAGAENARILRELDEPGDMNPVIQKPSVTYELLKGNSLTEDPTWWVNNAASWFFDKETIRYAEEDAGESGAPYNGGK